jgi:acyl-CoA thioesterase-1
MSRTFPYALSRRWFLGTALGGLAGSAYAAPPRRRIVTLLGDSITAGYGLPLKASLPYQLENSLGGATSGVRVRGAGVSGDTTADGLARVDFSVQKDTDVCVVALGGNDLLQGGDPKRVRANLDKIVTRLKSRGITVVLVGLKAPSVIGAGYARDFDAIYPAVAKANGVILAPNLLAGVAMDSRFNQRDGIHPNAAGVKVIAARLAPVIAKALQTRR